jgi:heme-degrading monooxygenase HmoA
MIDGDTGCRQWHNFLYPINSKQGHFAVMIVVVFRSRLKTEYAQEYAEVAARIDELAATTPGFLGIKSYAAADGERVSISMFETLEAVRQWREHPEHREAQALGKQRYYSEYRLQVCEVVRDYRHPVAPE